MPKGSPERTEKRKREIMDACGELYRTMSFREISLKDIGSMTSFSRPSIYNYFHTKEEIFLAIFEQEYELWIASLKEILQLPAPLERKVLAEKLATSLDRRQRLLKLLSMNLYDMEANSRPERLASFKVAFGNSMRAVEDILRKFIPEMTERDRRDFLYAFFPFMYGIYPYTEVTERQKQAMAAAGIPFRYQTAYQLTLSCLEKLLGIPAADASGNGGASRGPDCGGDEP